MIVVLHLDGQDARRVDLEESGDLSPLRWPNRRLRRNDNFVDELRPPHVLAKLVRPDPLNCHNDTNIDLAAGVPSDLLEPWAVRVPPEPRPRPNGLLSSIAGPALLRHRLFEVVGEDGANVVSDGLVVDQVENDGGVAVQAEPNPGRGLSGRHAHVVEYGRNAGLKRVRVVLPLDWLILAPEAPTAAPVVAVGAAIPDPVLERMGRDRFRLVPAARASRVGCALVSSRSDHNPRIYFARLAFVNRQRSPQ